VPPIITFTTDFGLSDHFVGAMKGVILNINPQARLVDICNSVQSFDVLDGALAIAESYHLFPTDTIHLVVVDPGVGSARRPVLARAGKHLFLAPDNGVLSLVYAREERVSVRHITAEHYFLQPVSQTFHGRDIFAAVAAHLSKGVEAEKFGEEISDYIRFAAPRPKAGADGELVGAVIKVDKFGNLITNLSPSDVPPNGALHLRVGKREITRLCSSYSEGAPGELFAIAGSMGLLEIATNRGAATRLCEAGRGAEVVLARSQG
jgi:S-adenosylmethionine hydrolase